MNAEEFLDVLGGRCGLPDVLSSRHLTMGLVNDLGLDSLDLLELVTLIEDIADISFGDAPAEFPWLVTLTDAVNYFSQISEWKS